MNNNKTIWALAAIVVVCVIALLIISPSMSQQKQAGAPTATSTAATTTTKAAAPQKTSATSVAKPAPKPVAVAPKVSGVGPLSSLLAFKESLVCSVKTSSAYMKRSGTVYVASGKLHGDFSSYINGALTDTFMIDDGTHLYAWKSGAANGLELLAASSASGSAIANAGGIDPAASVSYACNTWTEDPSLFVAPSSVTFSNTL